MKVSTLKTGPRTESRNDQGLDIQTYGEKNDYPQRLIEILEASGTGKSCIGVYAKFINGRGFASTDFFNAIVNTAGETTDYVLDQVVNDFAKFGGFALHVNYNALYKVISVAHIPFENVRFVAPDKEFQFSKVAIHPDWGRRNIKVRPFKPDDIIKVDLYDPDPEEIQMQVNAAEGWNNYKGQVYYFSIKGNRVYPTPIYDAVITDMSTEEGLSNIKYRNARNGFMPGGMIVDFDNTDQSGKNG